MIAGPSLCFTLLVATWIACGTVTADCAPKAKSIREQFQLSPTVVRLRHTDNDFVKLTNCSVEVQMASGYGQTTEIRSFVVVEVFKGLQDMANSSLPVLYDTDTGTRTDLPYEQSESFLAFLDVLDYCYDNGKFVELPETEPTVYTMNECIFVAGPWSEIDQENRQFLRDNALVYSSGGENVQTGLATDSAGVGKRTSKLAVVIGALMALSLWP